jgi:hypothetical protein
MIDISLNHRILEKHKAFLLGENKEDHRRLFKKLENAVTTARSEKVREILNYFLINMETISIGDIYQLDKIRKKFEEYLEKIPKNKGKKKSKELQELYNKLEIFKKEYIYFYNSPQWNAYEFQKELGVTVCPYCNSNFILIYESSKGRTRATLDHFFDKGRYPFLAISIYNLIPSCKVCNSDLKGKRITSLATHYSPYENNISKYMRFKKEIIINREEEIFSTESKADNKDIDYVSVMLGFENDFNIKLDIIDAPKEIEKKINGNKSLFHLEPLYNLYHKQYVQDIILKSYIYNYAYREQLSNTYKIFFNSPQQLRDTLMPSIELDKRNLLGKLTREIIEEETNNFMF